MVVFRKARVADADALSRMGEGLLSYHRKLDAYYTPKKDVNDVYKRFFKSCVYSSKRQIVVAEKDGKIIGYALAEISQRPPVYPKRRLGVVCDMYVEKSYRRKGVGKLMYKELKTWFREKKIKDVELSVHVKNTSGIKTWEKLGFTRYLIRKRARI